MNDSTKESAADLFAIVVAAGDGTRLGLGQRKAHVEIAGRPLPAWSIATLEAHADFCGGALVVHSDDVAEAAGLWIEPWSRDASRWQVVAGGATRTESVAAGLAVARDAEWVAIHDAARPLLSSRDWESVVSAAHQNPGGAILAHPVRDTVKKVRSTGKIDATLDRSVLFGAETPQVFRNAVLAAAFENQRAQLGEASLQATDDAAVVEAAGFAVLVVESQDPNPKLTDQFDLEVIAQLLSGRP